MAERTLLPWRKMWDYIGEIGEAPSLREMLRRAVEGFPRLVSCEHAIACLAEVDPILTKIAVSVHHNGAPEAAIRAYEDRYFYEDFIRLNLERTARTYQMDWRQSWLRDIPIAQEFIHGLLRIDLSAGIPMLDAEGPGGLNLCFTRIGTGRISSGDERIMLALRPHLLNLYTLFKRLENQPADNVFAAELAAECELLSKREAEIAGFLCKRLSAREIARLTMISKRTVETHVQHVYDKLGVNSRRELHQKLLGQH